MVDIQAQDAALEGREGVHVERHQVADDLVEEVFTESDIAVKEHLFVWL